ncbi:MAG: haloacid dehalogenase-like hydrolase [Zetaproteobacteria bacterium]|nr:MAG: haloacid dehalogenase-like hydrolase [Zetaproteobacteria bacterium]
MGATVRLGLDFDNTIVCYDRLFHAVALEQGLVPASLPPSKLAVRDHLRRTGRERRWTELQGYVYGARMDEALPAPGVVGCIAALRELRVSISIVSHKTARPVVGPPYDLHGAARRWIRRRLVDREGRPLIDEARIHFAPTRREKLARIAALGCTHFVDDLPEVVADASFPATCCAILYDPEGRHDLPRRGRRCRSWAEIAAFLTAAARDAEATDGR